MSGFTMILVCLAGCSAPRPAAVALPEALAAPAPAFSLNTPVDVIAANPGGKAVLDRDVPGLMASKSYMLFDDMSLSQIAEVSSGQLTQAKLDLVEADLSKLPGAPTP
jgi:hypothetical protein